MVSRRSTEKYLEYLGRWRSEVNRKKTRETERREKVMTMVGLVTMMG